MTLTRYPEPFRAVSVALVALALGAEEPLSTQSSVGSQLTRLGKRAPESLFAYPRLAGGPPRRRSKVVHRIEHGFHARKQRRAAAQAMHEDHRAAAGLPGRRSVPPPVVAPPSDTTGPLSGGPESSASLALTPT